MPVFPFEIEYYSTREGKKPFKAWLEGLKDVTGRAKIRVKLDRARLGSLGDYRSVGEGVHELRVGYGPGYRIYFAIEGRRLLLLLLGGDKSRQQRDIATAKEYWQDYKERKKHG
jgi:putative addiction module killer protein